MRTVVIAFAFLFSTPVFCQPAAADSVFAARQVDSLIQVSRDLITKKDFDKALEANAAAEQIILEKLGRASAAYGNCCFNLGRVYYFKRNYPETEKWSLEAKAIQEKILGKEHPDYALTLNMLASLYKDTGQYEKSESLYLESNAIWEKILGKENPSYVSSVGSLAILYVEMGNYKKAEERFLETLAIKEKILGKEHPDYASSLYNLALFYQKYKGNYKKAEQLLLESISIREKALGKEHPKYAQSLDGLATLYGEIGNYKEAESLHLEATSILGKVLGKEHPRYAESLNNLAISYVSIGNYEKAEPLYLEANAILEKTTGKNDLTFAGGLINLGEVYWRMKNYQKAEPLFLEAKAVFEIQNNRLHPFYAVCLNYLGQLYKDTENYPKAESLYLEAKDIREKMLGKEHPYYSNSLYYLADLYETQKRFNESEPLLEEYFKLTKANLSKATTFLSERELANFTATFKEHGDNLSSFLLNRRANNEREGILPALDFDHALFQKGFLLSTAVRLNDLAKSSPEAEEANNRLKGYRSRLTAEYAKPIAERNNVAELEEKANAAEKEIARTVNGYAEATRPVNWQDVQSVLKNGEAAIEFIRFQVNFPKNTDSTMYAALILRHGERQPEFIPLFEEKSLDSMLASSSARKADYVNAVYGFKAEANDPRAQKSLYERLWKPLEKDLEGSPAVDLSKSGTKTVYFSPSGLLHRLNLNAIPINDKETLSDRYHLVELGSTRQLVISPESNRNTPDVGQALLFGGVKYDLNSDSLPSQSTEIESNITGTRGDLNFSFTDSTDRGGSWNYLKWTDKEVTALEPILKSAQIQATVLKGYAATEEAFKSIGVGQPSPRILHIATHGFFFPDPKETKSSASGIGAEPVFKLSDHPMIRSGLILAGANQAWKTGKPFKPGMEDGILTAYEISQMDLSNTELVVLSACETGLGDIQGNEGVYGLQRAFKIAGAKYLIMSLWQVPDFQTQELMTTFYTNWLTRQMSIPDAFRAAQLTMREKYEHPYFWAGFVLVE